MHDASHFVDDIEEARQRWKQRIMSTLAGAIDTMFYVNLQTMQAEVLESPEHLMNIGMVDNAQSEVERAIRTIVCPEDQERVRAYLNLDTIGERVGNKTFISCSFRDTKGIMRHHVTIPAARDAASNVTEIITCIMTAEKEHKTET